jgi:hypothetical protein
MNGFTLPAAMMYQAVAPTCSEAKYLSPSQSLIVLEEAMMPKPSVFGPLVRASVLGFVILLNVQKRVAHDFCSRDVVGRALCEHRVDEERVVVRDRVGEMPQRAAVEALHEPRRRAARIFVHHQA